MKIVACIDSFKGSLSSIEAGNAVIDGAKKVWSDLSFSVLPLADGGEGTMASLRDALGGSRERVLVSGPLGNKIEANYSITPDKTAIMEMAEAAGLPLVPIDKRNPMHTTTFGVGEMIVDAINKGCRRFIIGIGGSATNDGGAGMLSALGYELLDEEGRPISPGAKGLSELKYISDKSVCPLLSQCEFIIACDVENPLCGDLGCSRIFAPQKGATKEDIEKMDAWLLSYGALASTVSDKADINAKGAGAAGGLGFAFLSFTNAKLKPGVQVVLSEIKLEEHIKDADLIVTGEGRLDAQTVMGKAPIGVARVAKKYGKKVVAFSGIIGEGAEKCNEEGIDAFFPIIREITSLEDALDKKNAYKNLVDTSTQVFRLIKLQGE